MRPTIRNVGFNLGGQLLPMLVAVVAMPQLAHRAGPDRLGFLGLAWALIGYFALLDLGLSRVVTRRVALADETGGLSREIDVVTRLCVRLFLLVAVISTLLAIAVPASLVVGKGGGDVVVGEARVALLILWATLPLTVVTGLLRGALEGLQQFGRVNLLRAFFGAWSFAAPLAVVLFWSNALGPLTLAVAIGRVLSLIAHATWAMRALRARDAAGKRDRPDLDLVGDTTPSAGPRMKDLFREGGWLTVSNVVGPLMVTFDRFAIAGLLSLAAASYYFVPQEISLRMLVVPGAIATTIFPMLARGDRRRADHSRVAGGALLAVVASCLPICAVIAALSGPLLTAWMGPQFAAASSPVARCLAVGLFANCCAQVPFAWIQAAGRSDVTGKLHLLQLPIYAVLLVVLTTRYGIVGAAVAWSARATADALLLHAASRRLFPDVALGAGLAPIVAGSGMLVLLAMTPALSDATVRGSMDALTGIACVALSLWLMQRLRRSLQT